MIISYDYSYLSELEQQAINQGLAKKYVYSIRLDRFFTEQEQEENRKQAETLTREQWAQRCDSTAERIGKQNFQALAELEKVFILGQYTKGYNGAGDFWFWCNCKNGKQQLDYITLTTQGTTDEKNAKAEQAEKILKNIDTKNNRAIIQYSIDLDDFKLEEIAYKYAEKMQNKFIKYGFMIGKIKRIDETLNNGYKWGFMKKGAKTKGYRLSNWNIYEIMNNN